MDTTHKSLTAICILLLIGMVIVGNENIKLTSENEVLKNTINSKQLCSPLGFCIGDLVKTNNEYNTTMNASYNGIVKKINGEVLTIDIATKIGDEEYKAFSENWLKHR